MYIRHLIGPRKGELEDMIFDRAKAKVEAGEAEDVHNQLNLRPIAMLTPAVRSERLEMADPVVSAAAPSVPKFSKRKR